MTQIYFGIFVISAISGVFSATLALDDKAMAKINMADALLQATAATQRNPALSAQCFAVYQPQLTAITDKYEEEHSSCLKAAEDSKDLINQEIKANYTAVQQLSANICSSYSLCTTNSSDSYAFFECNNEAASTAVDLSFNIQTISKERMQFITIKTELVNYDLNTCTDKCSQEYIADYSRVFGELQNCLNGKSPPSTTTTSTTTTTETTASTKFPTPPMIIDQ